MNYKNIKYNKFMITKLYLLVKLKRESTDVKVFFNTQVAFEFTQNEVLPHYLHLMFNEEYFEEFVGSETFKNYKTCDPVNALIFKIELLSECWDEMMNAAKLIWDYAAPGYFKEYLLTNGFKLDENQKFLWNQESQGLLSQN